MSVSTTTTALTALAAAAGDESGVTVLPDGRFADLAMLRGGRETIALAALYIQGHRFAKSAASRRT